MANAMLKGLRKSRAGKSCGYVEILRQGEKAYRTGLDLSSNPYPTSSEDFEVWAEGYEDAKENA